MSSRTTPKSVAQSQRKHNSLDRSLDSLYVFMLSLEASLALRWIWFSRGVHPGHPLSHWISLASTPLAAPFSMLFGMADARHPSFIFEFHPLVMMSFYGLAGLLLGQALRVIFDDRRP